jgi:16S rRNA (adenine1518-N6/adenine1519-N6)-dimethyltransferase
MTMDARTQLRQHNLRPRKGMGQHFLRDEAILRDIAAAASLTPCDVVVEVGPGLGALTTLMAPQCGRIIAVELDSDLVPRLHENVAQHPNVHIVQDDILEVNLPQVMRDAGAGQSDYKVVANLPYYITTPILRYFFDQEHRPGVIVVTVQAEVARRMVAGPPDMNFLAALVQFHGRPEIVRHIPPAAFYPPPKVDSAVVRIGLREPLPLGPQQARRFVRLLSAGFGQPRKQVHNPLAQATGLPRDAVIAALRSCGIDEKRRAETLALQDWLNLHAVLPQVW